MNLYGFVRNDGVDRWDRLGLDVHHLTPEPTPYPEPDVYDELKRDIERKFMAWYETERNDTDWINGLPDCPCDISCLKTACSSNGSWNPYQTVREVTYKSVCAPEGWDLSSMSDAGHLVVKGLIADFHPGAAYELRKVGKDGKSGQQCNYNENGKLITTGAGAGSADKSSPAQSKLAHKDADVNPALDAMFLDGNSRVPNPNGKYFQLYMKVRPTNNGKDAKGAPCQKNP